MGLEDDGASDYVHRLRRFRGPCLDRLRASTNPEDLIWLDGMGCRENSVCPLSPGALKTRIHRTITSPGLICPSCDGTITLDFRPHTFTVSGDVFVLICSSMDPRDMGSDEEDTQDYVHGLWGRARACLLLPGP